MSNALPAWFHKDREKRNKRSGRQERQVAKDVGGKVQPGSGSSWRARQDVKGDDDLIQVKFTDKAAFLLKAAEWEQVRTDALKCGREPAMIVELTQTGRRLLITEID